MAGVAHQDSWPLTSLLQLKLSLLELVALVALAGVLGRVRMVLPVAIAPLVRT